MRERAITPVRDIPHACCSHAGIALGRKALSNQVPQRLRSESHCPSECSYLPMYPAMCEWLQIYPAGYLKPLNPAIWRPRQDAGEYPCLFFYDQIIGRIFGKKGQGISVNDHRQ